MSDNDKPVAYLVEFESGDQELHFEKQAVGNSCVPLYARPQSGMVSEGYVLVPVKPTAAITKALKADFPLSTQGVRLIYSLIIKAAQEQQHE